MVRRVQSRAGVTLLEVLVAIFVMAIGMLAIFTLFPLGAINMAQALKDDRTRQTADQADAFMRMYWLNNMVNNPDTALRDSFENPNATPQSVPVAANQLRYSATPEVYPPITGLPQPSYPVLIDPLAFFAESPAGQERFWVARRSTSSGLLTPRRNLNVAIPPTSPPQTIARLAIETCCMVDDMSFQENGAPDPGLLRQGRYSWAAMVQRPRNNEPNTANLTVLVFEGRPPLLATPGDEVVVTVPPTAITPRSITIDVPNRSTDQTPLIRKGGWIMDGTIDPTTGVRNANFYRIAGVTEGTPGASNTPFVLDLQTDFKGPVLPTGVRIYLFAGLSEVFERRPLGTPAQ